MMLFLSLTGEKLLQYKLINIQCAKKSTRVPVSPVSGNVFEEKLLGPKYSLYRRVSTSATICAKK